MNRERQLSPLMAALGLSFRDPHILAEALVHSSYAHEHANSSIRHNERLEFLGDAVLDLVVSDWLFKAKQDMDEGAMTQARASVVCEHSLAKAARQIHLGDFLLLGCGERTKDGNYPPSILADAFEALIGAIYLDSGIEAVQTFVENTLRDALSQARSGNLIQDYKTQLQEVLQKDGARTIFYQVTTQEGPPHDRTFSVEVRVDGQLLGTGTGRSKKEAEQQAAKAALSAGCQ